MACSAACARIMRFEARTAGLPDPMTEVTMTAWLTTTQVARMAGCTCITVRRACQAGKITAEWGEFAINPDRRRHLARRRIWKIDPRAGRAWALNYKPWGRDG
jgi:hypothetical protein